jgi:transcriptional regulator with XRE-family HTH domain
MDGTANMCDTVDMTDDMDVFENINVALGQMLKARRLELGLTQAQAGQKLGVEQSTVSEWERGKSFPREGHQVWAHLGIPKEKVLAMITHMSQAEDEVERAINAQKALSAEAREALVTIYRKVRAAELKP